MRQFAPQPHAILLRARRETGPADRIRSKSKSVPTTELADVRAQRHALSTDPARPRASARLLPSRAVSRSRGVRERSAAPPAPQGWLRNVGSRRRHGAQGMRPCRRDEPTSCAGASRRPSDDSGVHPFSSLLEISASLNLPGPKPETRACGSGGVNE